ncbi:MAG: spore germination protein [Clostridia bacterium]|nr:spore germination protein [Clostridia bacterium]
MNIKNAISSFLTYTPKTEYEFDILENKNETSQDTVDEKSTPNEQPQKIEKSLSENLKYLQTTYNTLINSDIVIREFTLNARNKQYDAFLLYIDGMIDSNLLNDFVLKPLMARSENTLYEGSYKKVISESVTNNVTIRKIEKFNITEYLQKCLIPQNSVKQVDSFEQIISGVNSGNCALFVDTLNLAFDIEVKGFKQRSIDSPNNEVVVKGSQEAFVENIRTNTSILRRIINNENLIIENINIGEVSKTKCGICYMQNITNSDLVAETKYRINNLAIDALLTSGELEQLISDENELRNS